MILPLMPSSFYRKILHDTCFCHAKLRFLLNFLFFLFTLHVSPSHEGAHEFLFLLLDVPLSHVPIPLIVGAYAF